jgi:glycosyltransferase involved in cell wall biosynthesis
VSTFHDLFVISGDYSTPEFRRRFADQARKAAERSDLIIAVSQFTADQVEHLLHVDSSRIRVVHHGVDRPLKLPDPALRQPVILHVGAIQKRKNIVRLVEAFETLRSDWRLILAGGAGFGSGDILDRIARSPRRSSIEWTGYVDAGRLEELYARASIFAFPSLDEGFGMPVLDAMAHGVPVLTSGHGALKEVSGDAALHIDPEDSGSISNALHRLTESEALRTELTQAGLEHCSAFSWDIARRQTWRVYKDLE